MVNKTSNSDNAKQGSNPAGIPGIPPGMSQEQLQKLIAAMQAQQLAAMPKYKRIFMKFMQYVGPRFQAMVHDLDRFVNFVTQPSDKDRNDVIQAARGPILFGTYVAIIFFVFGGLWAAIAPLASAQPAIGMLISSTNKKIIQHQEGGIIKAIYVKQGDHLKAGDPIIELDGTKIKANHDASLASYRAFKAEECRLIAERDNLSYIEFSPDLLKDAEIPEVDKILDTQKYVFESKRAYISNLEKLNSQVIQQNVKRIEALKENKKVTEKNHKFLLERLEANKELFKKGIISKEAMSKMEVDYAHAKSQDLNTDTEILKEEQETAKLEIDLRRQKSQLFTETTRELEQVQQKLASAQEQYRSYKDSLDRIVITSPVDGIVNHLKYKTVGGVIGQGSEIAEISPEKDYLVVEARIPPKNIGYVTVGMNAVLRFSAFKSRTTPTFNGKVISISPDLVMDRNVDPRSENAAYYEARIEIDMDEFNKDAKRLNLTLVPGMQAEVQIITGTRTLLRYLLDPITDNMWSAFKEK